MIFTSALIKLRYPGITLAVLLGIAAMTIAQKYAGPVMLFAILIGLALHPAYEYEKFQQGIDWCARPLLLTGVALLGFRVNFHDVAALGFVTPAIAISSLISTIVVGCMAAKLLKVPLKLAILISGSVAICGVSAAVALAAALPKSESRDRNLALTIAGITVMSTLAMIAYPVVSQWLGHSSLQAGVFIGSSIHDVAQVVGAGYSISDTVGNNATLVKLMRVSALLPVVLIIGFLFRDKSSVQSHKYFNVLPLFLVVYLIVAGLNSYQIFPAMVQMVGSEASHYCLIISLVAIGLKTNLNKIRTVGKEPFILLAGCTLFLAAFTLLLIHWFI